jgi:hypothetical protein
MLLFRSDVPAAKIIEFVSDLATRERFHRAYFEFIGFHLKTIIKAIFLLVVLAANFQLFAQSDFEALKTRADAVGAQAQF